jgi:hypothetical protein
MDRMMMDGSSFGFEILKPSTPQDSAILTESIG